ncbi:tetratricopeptide repeat protein [candidate division CSSED10-310 bacterium]|uniref:Tetratricopeptide repeat protein n=1 Tax=candidate division CSSED10-310 bacterium TaxID=2855610 RepID=A0ABV6Z3Q4_UNCC1
MVNLALDRISQKHYDQALELLTGVVSIRADFLPAANALGTCYFYKGEYQQAKRHFLTAIELNPACIEPYFNLGQVLLQEQKADQEIHGIL